MGEGDHLVQHLIGPLGDVAQGGAGIGEGTLPHHEAVVLAQHVPLELLEIVVHLGPVGEVLHAVGHGDGRVDAGQARGLGDEGDHVLPEAVHPHVQPEAHDALHFFPDLRIVHVQIRLLFGEQMQIVFV